MKIVIIMAILALLAAQYASAQGLKITEVDASVDYDDAYAYRLDRNDRKDSVSVPIANNSNIDLDVFPGSNVTITTRVENELEGDDSDINGVFVNVIIEEIDDGGDFEEDSLDFDLESGNDYRFDTKFSIPLDVDAGTYNVILEAEGSGKNDLDYTTELRLKLQVRKQSHDMRITRLSLTPSVLSCDRKSKLSADIMNLGTNREDQIGLEFKSSSLGVSSVERDIVLESSDEASLEDRTHTKTYNIELPSFFKAGTYPIVINLYWKNFVFFDQKTADLIIRDCGPAVNPDEEPDVKVTNASNLTHQENGQAEKSPGQGVVIAPRRDGSNMDFFLIAAGGLIIMAVAAFIILGANRKSNSR